MLTARPPRTRCADCSGSGSCDVCDGYGTTPDSYPGADDGRGCPACLGDGVCPRCHRAQNPCTASTPEEEPCR